MRENRATRPRSPAVTSSNRTAERSSLAIPKSLLSKKKGVVRVGGFEGMRCKSETLSEKDASCFLTFNSETSLLGCQVSPFLEQELKAGARPCDLPIRAQCLSMVKLRRWISSLANTAKDAHSWILTRSTTSR